MIETRVYGSHGAPVILLHGGPGVPGNMASLAQRMAPALMSHGSYDPHPGTMIYESLKPWIPHLQYTEFERCGHYPWLEKSVQGKFLQALRDWLRSTSPR